MVEVSLLIIGQQYLETRLSSKVCCSTACNSTCFIKLYPINVLFPLNEMGPSWSYGSWIYNYLCNKCISPLPLRVRIPLTRSVLDTTLCDKVYQWLAAGRWFSQGTTVSSTNKTDHRDITEILLKVALNTITRISIKESQY